MFNPLSRSLCSGARYYETLKTADAQCLLHILFDMPQAPRIVASPAAGQFDVDADCQFRCSVRKGDIRENPRGGKSVEFKMKISEGLGVATAKVLSFVQRTMNSAQLISDDLYFKKSKGAAQSQYLKLTEDTFEEMTRSRWNLISSRDVSSWTRGGKSVLESFFFEVFVYIQRRATENVPTGLRRATAARIEASTRQIRNYEESTGERLGPITRNHAAISQARQPEGEEFEMPTDNTTRQAQFLDEQREEQVREGDGGNDEERNRKKIRLELNGTWVDVWVDVSSLRLALGLPPHDLFASGIFNNYVHHETVGADVEDTDHGAPERRPAEPARERPTAPLSPPSSPDSQGLVRVRVMPPPPQQNSTPI